MLSQLASEFHLNFVTLVKTGQMQVFRTYSQYSYPICSQLEAASDVMSGVAVEEVDLDVSVKFGDSTSKRSRVMQPAHFVTDD